MSCNALSGCCHAEQLAELHTWTTTILDGMAKEGKAKLPAAPAASSAKRKKKQQQQQPFEDDKSRIMSFFG